MKTATIELNVINCNKEKGFKTTVSLVTDGIFYKIVTTTGNYTTIQNASNAMVARYKDELNDLLKQACETCNKYPCKCKNI